jgi:hypothetical protein
MVTFKDTHTLAVWWLNYRWRSHWIRQCSVVAPNWRTHDKWRWFDVRTSTASTTSKHAYHTEDGVTLFSRLPGNNML